jgi:integrase-like protein
VTHLRKLMLEELQRRNYSDDTIRSYIYTVEDFARRFNCPPDRLGPRHIREYQAELFQKRKLSSGTVTIRLAPLGTSIAGRRPMKTLRRAIGDYLSMRRSLGFKLSRHEPCLR